MELSRRMTGALVNERLLPLMEPERGDGETGSRGKLPAGMGLRRWELGAVGRASAAKESATAAPRGEKLGAEETAPTELPRRRPGRGEMGGVSAGLPVRALAAAGEVLGGAVLSEVASAVEGS
jgi:hypothetical protein